MPEPRGRIVYTTAFVDASHASNKVTRRSQTGFLIFINRAPIIWYSKKQSTVECSAFSSEFLAMRTCIESIVSLRYKLRMFGVPISGPTEVFCDNNSVVLNSSNVESKLNKKNNSLAYHYTRWSVAAEIIRVGWIDGKENLADVFTKILPVLVREYLFGNWTYQVNLLIFYLHDLRGQSKFPHNNPTHGGQYTTPLLNHIQTPTSRDNPTSYLLPSYYHICPRSQREGANGIQQQTHIATLYFYNYFN